MRGSIFDRIVRNIQAIAARKNIEDSTIYNIDFSCERAVVLSWPYQMKVCMSRKDYPSNMEVVPIGGGCNIMILLLYSLLPRRVFI